MGTSRGWFVALPVTMALVLVPIMAMPSVSLPKDSQRPSFPCPMEDRSVGGMPCICTNKQNGLDISCDRVTQEVVNATLGHVRRTQSKISYLKLRHLDLPSLPDHFFGELSIQHLTVIYSKLNSVSEHAFAGLEEDLETLDLSQNRLKMVPQLALRGLKNIIHLNLNHNNITFLHAGALDGLENLLRVTFYGNGITGLHENAVGSAAQRLVRINLGRNRFGAFPIQALKSLRKLEGLEIQENDIERIDKGDFFGLEQLDYINLASNRISELKPETFKHLHALNSLDLGNNRISNIDKDTFVGVEVTLEWLMLGENRLQLFPSVALKKLRKLKQLDLHSNNLTSIPDDAFDDFGGQLKSIGLHNNSISHIPPNAFYNLHVLQWLHLHENKLQRIPQEIFEPVFDTLTTLDVYDNPLICDCELRWFRNWIETQGRKILRVMEKTQCHEPSALHGRAIHDVQVTQMTCPMTTNGISTSMVGSTASYVANFCELALLILPFILFYMPHELLCCSIF